MNSTRFKKKMPRDSIKPYKMMIDSLIQNSTIVSIKWMPQCLGNSMKTKQNK